MIEPRKNLVIGVLSRRRKRSKRFPRCGKPALLRIVSIWPTVALASFTARPAYSSRRMLPKEPRRALWPGPPQARRRRRRRLSSPRYRHHYWRNWRRFWAPPGGPSSVPSWRWIFPKKTPIITPKSSIRAERSFSSARPDVATRLVIFSTPRVVWSCRIPGPGNSPLALR